MITLKTFCEQRGISEPNPDHPFSSELHWQDVMDHAITFKRLNYRTNKIEYLTTTIRNKPDGSCGCCEKTLPEAAPDILTISEEPMPWGQLLDFEKFLDEIEEEKENA
jgi:hypothetical protein